ncbi:MAG: hypothetical protein EA367_01565 [Leptolyngbya sp. DLM2.Bin15]|nr:MAG: hypothetical protein EA367_01565 [Leptolyngbya sp. DLM2.Bin15]
MAPSELPENWQDLIADYALGSLPPEDMEQVQQWLSDDPAVQKELQAYQEVLALLPYALPLSKPSRRVKQRLLTAVGDPSAGSAWRPRRMWLWAAIALGLGLVLGGDNLRLRQQVADRDRLQQELAAVSAERDRLLLERQDTDIILTALGQPSTTIYTLQGVDPATQTYGSLVTLTDRSEMVLISHSLPPLAGDRIYRLWSVPDESADPVYCGEFNSDETGTSHWTAPSNSCVNPPHQLLITIDRVTDPPLPTGRLVMASKA